MIKKTRKGLFRMGLVLLTRKGLVTDVLDSSLNLSFYAYVVFGGLTSSTLRCSRSVYRFQGIMYTYTLVLHVRKSLYACCFVQ